MKRFLRNARALSPVLSNVLLMLIAVAGMSIAITASYVITGNLHDTMGERFIVEDIWFRSGEIRIYLRNTGKVSIRIAAVYINYTSQSFADLTMEEGEHGWLNVAYVWSAYTVYHMNVVSSRGTKIADYYRSPALSE